MSTNDVSLNEGQSLPITIVANYDYKDARVRSMVSSKLIRGKSSPVGRDQMGATPP